MRFSDSLWGAVNLLLVLFLLLTIQACGPVGAPGSRPDQDAAVNHVLADPVIPFRSVKLETKQDLVDAYCESMRYYYFGSDINFHYFINNFDDEVLYIRKSIVGDDDFRSIFKIKISRDRSVVPHWPGVSRSREFLDWKKNTKFSRIDGVELEQDW